MQPPPFLLLRTPFLAVICLLIVSVNAIGQSGRCGDGTGKSVEAEHGDRVECSPRNSATVPAPSRPLPPEDSQSRASQNPSSLERNFIRNLIADQRNVWTSPLRLKRKDAFWILPSVGLTYGIFSKDVDVYRGLQLNPAHTSSSKTFSDAGVVALATAAGTLYLAGRVNSDQHAREAGVLSAESLANALAFSYTLKYSLGRQRPFEGDNRGDFFSHGDSFPSTHAISAWAIASVLAHEYPGPLSKIGLYGLASAVSLTRVTGGQHFPSDVVIGSALGWGIGRQVYRRHHNTDLPGADIGRFVRSHAEEPPSKAFGSAYVPLESWVYQAMDRLSALGIVDSAFTGQRPWTRLECARLLQEADQKLLENEISGEKLEMHGLQTDLRREFQYELGRLNGTGEETRVHLESVYSRVLNTSGPALSDGYHFGQTIQNDYGRPFQSGTNLISGFSGWAIHDRWIAYVRGEFQHSPFAPALPQSALATIGSIDQIPVPPGVPFNEVNRFRMLDSYVGLNLKDWQLSFGQQSMWWGPDESGAMNFSNNASPVLMVRATRVAPLVLPGILRYLGPTSEQFFFGRLSGQKYVRIIGSSGLFFAPPLNPQPYIQGGKFSFKPTPNLEFGVSVTSVFGGPGFPITYHTFIRSLGFTNTAPGRPSDPGDRRAGFDFKYRIPGLRNWLTLYNDSVAEDEISPIGYPRRSAQSPGIYMPRIPGIPKLDFRAEGFYTDLPNLRLIGSYYFNEHYLSGYTNQGNLLGHTIGRSGAGFMAASRYWFSPQRKLQAAYRHATVSSEFIPGGGKVEDFSVQSEWLVGKNVSCSGLLQYERWRIPVLSSSPQSNVTSSFQIVFRPPPKE